MKYPIPRTLLAAAFSLLAAANLSAASFSSQSGITYEGDIVKILDGQVTIATASESVELALSDLDYASQAAVKAWGDAHPEAVDVYTKWDDQPKIKSSSMPILPKSLALPDFKGMVSVDLILDESGQVIHASVNKSTHAELDEPSVEAAKTWVFEPAKIGGKAVKSKLRVPFKFVYTPKPAPPVEG